jgi:hypothetical protein
MPGNGTTRHAAVLMHEVEAALAAARGIPESPGWRAAAGLGERIRRLALSDAPPSTVLVRAVIGAVFLLEGTLKFVDPQGLGVGS